MCIHIPHMKLHIQFMFLVYITDEIWLLHFAYRSHWPHSFWNIDETLGHIYTKHNQLHYLLHMLSIYVPETNMSATLHIQAYINELPYCI